MQHNDDDKGKEKEEKTVTVYFSTASVAKLATATPSDTANLFHQATRYAKDRPLYFSVAELCAANRTMRVDVGIAELVIPESALEKDGTIATLKPETDIKETDITRLYVLPNIVSTAAVPYPLDPVSNFAYVDNPIIQREIELKKELKIERAQSLFDIALRLLVINHDHAKQYPDRESLNDDAMIAILEKALPDMEPREASRLAIAAFVQANKIFTELMDNRATVLNLWQEITGPDTIALWKELGNGEVPATVKRIQAVMRNGELSDMEKVVQVREAILNRDKTLAAKAGSVFNSAVALFSKGNEEPKSKRHPLTALFYAASLAALGGQLKPLAEFRIEFELKRAELQAPTLKSRLQEKK